MKLLWLIPIIFLMAGIFAYNISSSDYSIGSNHYGLIGGITNSTDYSMRSTSDANQATSSSVYSTDFMMNVGWFNISFSITPATLTIVSDIFFINATVGHAFSATATVQDLMGGNHITSVSITSTIGSCLQFSNSTSGVNLTAVFVCLSAVPATTNVFITFNDGGLSASTSTKSNTYPDHNASLSPPQILPNPTFNDSSLLCNAGTFSDIDGDAENPALRTWAWSKNSVIITGETSQTLGIGNYSVNDVMRCYENASSSIWLTSNASAVSAPSTVYERPVGIWLEIVGFWFLICLAFILLAEYSNANLTLGFISSILIVLMGAWMLGTPIVIHTANTSIYTQNSTYDNSSIPTTNISYFYIDKNQTNVYKYTPIYTPIFNFNQILGIIFMLVGVLLAFRYSAKFQGK